MTVGWEQWLRMLVLITGLIAVVLGLKLRLKLGRDEWVRARVFLGYTRYVRCFLALGVGFLGMAIVASLGLIYANPDQLFDAQLLIIGGLLLVILIAYILVQVLISLR